MNWYHIETFPKWCSSMGGNVPAMEKINANTRFCWQNQRLHLLYSRTSRNPSEETEMQIPPPAESSLKDREWSAVCKTAQVSPFVLLLSSSLKDSAWLVINNRCCSWHQVLNPPLRFAASEWANSAGEDSPGSSATLWQPMKQTCHMYHARVRNRRTNLCKVVGFAVSPTDNILHTVAAVGGEQVCGGLLVLSYWEQWIRLMRSVRKPRLCTGIKLTIWPLYVLFCRKNEVPLCKCCNLWTQLALSL